MNAPTNKTVVFSHSKESGPWGAKITRLARVAQELGFAVVSIDYKSYGVRLDLLPFEIERRGRHLGVVHR